MPKSANISAQGPQPLRPVEIEFPLRVAGIIFHSRVIRTTSPGGLIQVGKFECCAMACLAVCVSSGGSSRCCRSRRRRRRDDDDVAFAAPISAKQQTSGDYHHYSALLMQRSGQQFIGNCCAALVVGAAAADAAAAAASAAAASKFAPGRSREGCARRPFDRVEGTQKRFDTRFDRWRKWTTKNSARARKPGASISSQLLATLCSLSWFWFWLSQQRPLSSRTLGYSKCFCSTLFAGERSWPSSARPTSQQILTVFPLFFTLHACVCVSMTAAARRRRRQSHYKYQHLISHINKRCARRFANRSAGWCALYQLEAGGWRHFVAGHCCRR